MKAKIIKIMVVLSLLSFALLSLSPGLGMCSSAPPQTEQQVNMSKADLTTLTENNRKQSEILTQSKQALQTASEALTQSQTALSEAKEQLLQSRTQMQALQQESKNLKDQLNESQVALTESQQQTTQLLAELNEQKRQTQALNLKWGELQSYAARANDSITKANESLQNTRMEFQQSEKAHEKAEKTLNNKITAWQIIAGLLAGYAISK